MAAFDHRYGKTISQKILLELPVSRGGPVDLAGSALATASRRLHDLKDDGPVRTRDWQHWIVRSDRLEKDHQENFDQDQGVF